MTKMNVENSGKFTFQHLSVQTQQVSTLQVVTSTLVIYSTF